MLLNRATVKNGRIELPGGASYALLVIPGKRRMNPEAGMSLAVGKQLLKLVKEGATLYFQEKPTKCLGSEEDFNEFEAVINELFAREGNTSISENIHMLKIGKGRVLTGKFDAPSFTNIGIEKDFYALNTDGKQANKLAWNHRSTGEKEIYFISNQEDRNRDVELSFRVSGKEPELYFPVLEITEKCNNWRIENGRTIIPFKLENNESVFVIFEKESTKTEIHKGVNNVLLTTKQRITGKWEVRFDTSLAGHKQLVIFEKLTDWSLNSNGSIKYYSGTAVYQTSFEWNEETKNQNIWIELGEVNNLAEVSINGVNCGVAWTAPFRLNITKALKKGTNMLEIKVTNTWANRIIGDHNLPENQQVTWTNAPYRLQGNSLLKAGLLGPVEIKIQEN